MYPLIRVFKLLHDPGALLLVVLQGFVEALIEDCDFGLSFLMLRQAILKQVLTNDYKLLLVGKTGVKVCFAQDGFPTGCQGRPYKNAFCPPPPQCFYGREDAAKGRETCGGRAKTNQPLWICVMSSKTCCKKGRDGAWPP